MLQGDETSEGRRCIILSLYRTEDGNTQDKVLVKVSLHRERCCMQDPGPGLKNSCVVTFSIFSFFLCK